MIRNIEYFPETTKVFQKSQKNGIGKFEECHQNANLSQYINEVFATEYDAYIKDDEYFPGCPFKLYRRTFYDRLDNYILNYPASDEFDFLNQENEIIKNLLEMHPENNENFYSFYTYLFPNSHQKILKSSLHQIRKNFIDKRIIELDHYLSITGVDPINYHKMPMQHIGLLRNPDQRNIEKPQFYEPFDINSEKKSIPKNSKMRSLVWNSNDHSELNHIHKELKENGYLNCDLRSFKRLFLGNVDFDKITWLKADSSLIYFYGKLIETNKIQSPSNKWVKFKQIFEYSGTSASSLYSQYKYETKNLPDKSFFDSLLK